MWLLWVTLAVLVLAALLGASAWVAHDPWSLVELRKLPRSTIATAFGETSIRLVGTVRAIHSRLAPSGAPYVLQHTITEERQRHGRHVPGIAETTWVRTSDDVDAGDFWLDDGTGRALVIVRGELVRPLLVHARYTSTSEVGDRRSLEAVVVDGDRIAVCGYATWDVGDGGATILPDDSSPETSGRRLVIRAGDRIPIVISDEPTLRAD